MLKHIVILLVLSISAILFMPQLQFGLNEMLLAHKWVANELKNVFSGDMVGNIIRQLLALLVMPILIGLIPVFLYWLAKRTWFPWSMEIIWLLWVMQLSAIAFSYVPAAPVK